MRISPRERYFLRACWVVAFASLSGHRPRQSISGRRCPYSTWLPRTTNAVQVTVTLILPVQESYAIWLLDKGHVAADMIWKPLHGAISTCLCSRVLCCYRS